MCSRRSARPAPRNPSSPSRGTSRGRSARSGPTGLVIVAVGVADPGNLGTLLRSAEAAGAAGVVCTGSAGGNSVDVHNPKTVRSSAGALFGVTVVEEVDPMFVLSSLAARGRRTYATRPGAVMPYDAVDFSVPCAVVLGNEAHGLSPEVRHAVDGVFSIPMSGRAESLNVAMAGTVVRVRGGPAAPRGRAGARRTMNLDEARSRLDTALAGRARHCPPRRPPTRSPSSSASTSARAPRPPR